MPNLKNWSEEKATYVSGRHEYAIFSWEVVLFHLCLCTAWFIESDEGIYWGKICASLEQVGAKSIFICSKSWPFINE
jgi:hypothetical protein